MPKTRRLTVGAFQFAGSGDPTRNVAALARGVEQAARHGVRLLVTQECALCGYPPIEVPSSRAMNRQAQSRASRSVAELAREHGMYIVLGMATFRGAAVFNTTCLVDPRGTFRRPYHKRALYGWDKENFRPGDSAGGVYVVDGVRVGVRICFEVRFPGYFRELFRRRVDLAVVPFADGGTDQTKLGVLRSHLVSRAAENAMYVLSANSTSRPQAAPTCLIDPDGRIVAEAALNREALLTGAIALDPPGFGRQGRIGLSRVLSRPRR